MFGAGINFKVICTSFSVWCKLDSKKDIWQRNDAVRRSVVVIQLRKIETTIKKGSHMF